MQYQYTEQYNFLQRKKKRIIIHSTPHKVRNLSLRSFEKSKIKKIRKEKNRVKRSARYRFGDDSAPAFIEGPLHNGVVGAGRARSDDKGVGHFQPVYSDTEIGLWCLAFRSQHSESDTVFAKMAKPWSSLRRKINSTVIVDSHLELLSQTQRHHLC